MKRLQALFTICGAVGGEFMDAALVEYVALWGQFVQQLSADFDAVGATVGFVSSLLG